MSAKSVPPPNHTQTPNAFYDEMLAEIDTMSELKVTLAIIRKTFGWHKGEEGDAISLSQLETITGMGRQQVVAGCKSALARGYVWREKREGRNYFGLNVGGYDDNTPSEDRGMTSIPEASMTSIPTKERVKEKENVEANASSAIAQSDEVIGLEKHIVDGIYHAMREAHFRLPNEHFTYHLGRAKDVLEKDDPTDEEIEGLPEAFVGLWTIKGKADAHSALMEMRRQKARPGLVKTNTYGVTPEERSEQTRRSREGYEHLFKDTAGGADEPAEPFDKDAMLQEMRGERKQEVGAA